MIAVTATTLPGRLVGAIRLDRRTYIDIEADSDGMIQTLTVVVLAGLANGISLAVTSEIGPPLFFTALIGNLGFWLIFGGLAFVVGTTLLPDDATIAESTGHGVLRAVGFAQAPSLAGILGVIGLLGQILAFVALAWTSVCSVVAFSVALRVSTSRAFAIGLISGLATMIPLSIFLLLAETIIS